MASRHWRTDPRVVRSRVRVLDAALAWVDCTVHSRIDGGDHTIFIGRVVAAGAVDGTPLLYYRSGYGRFES